MDGDKSRHNDAGEDEMINRRWGRRICLLLIFLLAFLPRALTPISRPLQWHLRSIKFIAAVQEGRWVDTQFSEHPGVTTMWIAGIAQHAAYHLQKAFISEQYPPHPGEVEGRAFASQVAIGVGALATFIACLITLSWFPLKRLFGKHVAWVGVVLMALDPYYIANSKVLHIDAMLATLMMFSALAMLVYGQDDDLKALVISGIFGGLALLTKSPAFFLIPFSALALLIMRGNDIEFSIRRLFCHLVLPLLIWSVIAAVIFVSLYPAMWGDPIGVLKFMADRTAHHATTAHINPVYFQGQPHIDDPGPWYYIYVLAFKSSGISLSLMFLALVTLRSQPTSKFRPALLVVLYMLCFGLQMTLGAKKGLRYLLPLFPMFDVMAAIGWTRWRQGVTGLLKRPCLARWIAWVPTVILAAMVLPLHPYYGTHYNWLWGGIQSAKAMFSLQEQAEGVDVAARWLDAYDEENLHVAVQQPGMLVQYTESQVVEFDDPRVDYFVLDRNHIVRNYRPFEWGKVWKRYRSREPAFQVSFCGIPYVWVYEALPRSLSVDTPDLTMDGKLGDNIELLGYDWQEAQVSPGASLSLHLYWRASQSILEDYTVFVHLVGPDGRLLAQCDSEPVGDERPTSSWRVGEMIRDECEVVLPSEAPPGKYQVFVGMYSWPGLERLPVYGVQTTRMDQNRLLLTKFELKDSTFPWCRTVVAWIVALFFLTIGVSRRSQEEKVTLV
jgi:hypothetical protein